MLVDGSIASARGIPVCFQPGLVIPIAFKKKASRTPANFRDGVEL
jgi:hypothetical protein